MPAAVNTDIIKLLIADDHPVVLEGLALMIKNMPGIRITGFARNAYELIDKNKQFTPDIILMDVIMPPCDALDTVKALKESATRPRIICCSSTANRAQIMSLIGAGINGYIMKSASIDELKAALISVSNNADYFSPEITATIISAIRSGEHPKLENVPPLFTEKEIEIIRLICHNQSAKQISEHLNINARTIEAAKIRIMKKMSVKNVIGIVYYALRNQLVDVNDLNPI